MRVGCPGWGLVPGECSLSASYLSECLAFTAGTGSLPTNGGLGVGKRVSLNSQQSASDKPGDKGSVDSFTKVRELVLLLGELEPGLQVGFCGKLVVVPAAD